MKDLLHVGIDAACWHNARGFGRFTRELITALLTRATGFRYTLFFDQPPAGEAPAGAAVAAASTGRSLAASTAGTGARSLRYLWSMHRLVCRTPCDLFFFPAVYSYFPIPSGLPCVVCYHDATAERFPELVFPTTWNRRLWQVKTALALRQTTRAVTVSQSSAADLERLLRIPRERIDIVPEAADPAFRVIDDRDVVAGARARCGVPDGADLLVHVGGMNAHKNIFGLLQAMPDIVAAAPRTFLAIVGDTSAQGFWDNVPALRAFVQSHPPLDRHVRFTGYVPDAELAALMNGAAALVFPSLWEGFGLPAVEAMACGLPVLASRRGSLPEVVGDAGLFFEPENPASIRDCLLAFLRDPCGRERLRARGLQRSAQFTWDRSAALAEASFRRGYAGA